MRMGNFHKKKRYFFNKIKVNFLSFLKGKKVESACPDGQIKSCLIIHDNNKIGDLIVLSSLYREFKLRGVKLSILTTESGKAFLRGNKNIHHFFIKKSDSLKDVLKLKNQLRKQHFDIVLDPFETMPSFSHSLLLSSVNSSHILGFDRWYLRYYSYYHPHDEALKAHMCTRANEILAHYYGTTESVFNISYDLPISADIEKKVREFVDNKNIVIINPLGAKKICRLTPEQIELIYSHVRRIMPAYRIIFTGLPRDLQSIAIDHIETLPFDDFIYTVALTKFSKYVITVDTALVHIASAYNIPTLALYPNARQPSYPSHLIWAPNNDNALQIVSSTYTVKDISSDLLTHSLNTLLSQSRK